MKQSIGTLLAAAVSSAAISSAAVATAAFAGAVVVAATIVGCNRGHDQAGASAMAARPPAPVTVSAAFTRDVPVYLDEIGKTAARESVSVIPQVGGKVVSVHFTEGTDVKKGDLLFEIDPRPSEAALAQAEANLGQRRAELTYAQTQWKNVEGLQSQAAISKEEYEQRRTTVGTAEAQVKAAEAAVAIAKLNLEYCRVLSPIDGRTGQVLIDPGNVVKANEGTLTTIQRLDPIYADFTVTERELQEVRRNMAMHTLAVEVSLPQTQVQSQIPAASTQANAGANGAGNGAGAETRPATTGVFDNTPRRGELTFLDNLVQDATGTVKLRATVPNAERYFWPGQFVNVRLVLQVKKDAVLVPSAATQVGQQGTFVFVVQPGQKDGKPVNTAQIRPVIAGQRQGDLVVIEQGLEPGEQVVVQGQMMIAPGAEVTVTNPQRPAAPQANAASAVGS